MMRQIIKIIRMFGVILFLSNCAGKSNKTDETMIITQTLNEFVDTIKQNPQSGDLKTSEEQKKYKVTFIELGSVRCVPCQMMQPVMKSIEEKYTDQVKVVFYDVWTPEGRPFADQYAIQLIPTQVFLDKNGKEFFRHEGFFPEEELIKILHIKDVK